MRHDEVGPNPDAIAGAPPPIAGLHRVNGTALYAEVRGSGPSVLLIPGGAEDAEGWRQRAAVSRTWSQASVMRYLHPDAAAAYLAQS